MTRVKKKKKRVGERSWCGARENFTELCSGSVTDSYLRLIDFVYHSTRASEGARERVRASEGERERERERAREGERERERARERASERERKPRRCRGRDRALPSLESVLTLSPRICTHSFEV